MLRGVAQSCKKICWRRGKIVGVDLRDMDPIDGVDFIKGDFRDPKIVEQIRDYSGFKG